jgi:hypothetical protein
MECFSAVRRHDEDGSRFTGIRKDLQQIQVSAVSQRIS